jgi:hypothetical protein
VWSVLNQLPEDWFAVVKLTVDLAKKHGVVVIEDGNEHEHYRQEIPYTDFPLSEIKLYLEQRGNEKVLLLPTEH